MPPRLLQAGAPAAPQAGFAIAGGIVQARAALPQPPCSPAHAALYRSRIGSRTHRCQPDFDAAPRATPTGFAADARRRGRPAWGPERAGARRAPAATLLARTRRTLQTSNRMSHAQMRARFRRRSPSDPDRFCRRRAPTRQARLGSRTRWCAPRSRSHLARPHTPHFTDLESDGQKSCVE